MTYERTWFHRCAICKNPVNLEQSKADEHGKAVHEVCYVAKIVGERNRRKKMTWHVDEPHSVRPAQRVG
jgi:hypothetical protein